MRKTSDERMLLGTHGASIWICCSLCRLGADILLIGIHSAAPIKHQSCISGTTVGWLEVVVRIFVRVVHPWGVRLAGGF